MEHAWRAAEAPILPYLAPGLGARAVGDALRGVGLHACDELVTWFGWHNGTVGNERLGYETRSLSGGVFLQSLEQALESYAFARQMVETITSQGGDPSEYYPARAFPITRHLGPYLDVVSCDPDSAGDAWFVSWDGPAEPNGPHLADLVERIALRWSLGVEAWVDGNWALRDEAHLGIGPNVPW